MFQVRTAPNASEEGETATTAQAATAILAAMTGAQKAALLGLTAYADLTAANTALASGVLFWNTALAKVDLTTA